MKINTLCIALKGISAYRDICKTPLMEQVTALLNAVFAGLGEDAAGHYAEVFYQLRQEGCAGWGSGWTSACGMTKRPIPC